MGVTSATSVTGATGPQGATGAASTVAGPQRSTLATGATGQQGSTGATGATGLQGATGAEGNALELRHGLCRRSVGRIYWRALPGTAVKHKHPPEYSQQFLLVSLHCASGLSPFGIPFTTSTHLLSASAGEYINLASSVTSLSNASQASSALVFPSVNNPCTLFLAIYKSHFGQPYLPGL